MGILIWWIAGLIMLAITIFVHRNTYIFDGYRDRASDRLDLQRWVLILMCIIAAIPILNLVVFIVGIGAYFISIVEEDIVFKCESRWWKSITKWLTTNV